MTEIVYYTCNTHLPEIDDMCRAQLLTCNVPIVSVSRNKDLDFGDVRLRYDGEYGPLSMHRQILMGLEASTAEYIFLCESDVLYHPSHFDFEPTAGFLYNQNVWKYRWDDGFTFRTTEMSQVSGVVAHRDTLLDFYRQRVPQIEKEGFNRHFEPGLKQTLGSKEVHERFSEFPNICIRHDNNITKSKFSPGEFRNKQYAEGWTESSLDKIPGWETYDIRSKIL